MSWCTAVKPENWQTVNPAVTVKNKRRTRHQNPASQANNPEVVGSNPAPATNFFRLAPSTAVDGASSFLRASIVVLPREAITPTSHKVIFKDSTKTFLFIIQNRFLTTLRSVYKRSSKFLYLKSWNFLRIP